MEAATPPPPELREALAQLSRYWWLWLVFGVVWIIIALVILQFDDASLTTIGVIIGAMFIAAGIQYLTLAALGARWTALWIIFGVLLVVGGVVAIFNPADTFKATADVLGFIFLLVGIFWTVEAFTQRDENELWWLGLIAGILMIVLAFWTAGQFFLEKAYILIIFAGIWALMHGITDIVRAFQVRRLGRLGGGS